MSLRTDDAVAAGHKLPGSGSPSWLRLRLVIDVVGRTVPCRFRILYADSGCMPTSPAALVSKQEWIFLPDRFTMTSNCLSSSDTVRLKGFTGGAMVDEITAGSHRP